MYRVETGSKGMELYWNWRHLFILLFEETVLFATKIVCKKQKLTRVCNQYPMLALLNAGLRIYIGKSFLVKSGSIVRGKRTTVPTGEQWERVD